MMVAFSKLHLLRSSMPHIPLRRMWGFQSFTLSEAYPHIVGTIWLSDVSQYLSGSRLDYSSGGWKYVNVRFGRSLPVPRAGCRR